MRHVTHINESCQHIYESCQHIYESCQHIYESRGSSGSDEYIVTHTATHAATH